MSQVIGRRAVILVAILVALLAGARVGLAQNQVSTTPISDFPLPPPTFDQMIAAVDLVVYGTVTKTGEPQHRRTSRGRDYVFRFQSVKVREVLSPRTNVKDKDSATIAIWQSGGTLVVDGREVSTAYDEMFLHPGDVVVLFLRRAADGSFSIAYGPGGLIRLDDAKGYASLPNRLRHVTDVGNRSQMSTQDLLGAIRKASRKH